MPAEPTVMAFALVVIFLAALVQGTIGLGLGMLSVPVLILVDPVLAPVPQLIVTLPLTLVMLRSERHAIDWWGVGRVALARIPGIGLGIGLLAVADQRLLDATIAFIVLGAVAVIASGVSVHRNRTSELVAGATSGATGTISSIGGPPVALLYREETGPEVRSNLAAIFGIGIAMILAARAVSGHLAQSDLVVAAWYAPMVTAGYVASRSLRAHLVDDRLRTAILALSATAALVLLVRSVAG